MPEPKTYAWEDLVPGTSESFTVDLSPSLVDAFAELSGDRNPLHVDAAFAAHTTFGERVPHGMIAGMLFSRLIGMYLPGRDALYLSQTLEFAHPLPLTGTVRVTGSIRERSEATRTVRIQTSVSDGTNLLVRGEALVRLLSPL